MHWLGLAVGAVMGAFSRYLLTEFVHSKTGPSFPWGTMGVNTLGCLIAGIFFSLFLKERGAAHHGPGLFWLAGFCGSFTTFSALVLDSSSLADAGRGGASLANVALTLALGFAAFLLGRRIPGLF